MTSMHLSSFGATLRLAAMLLVIAGSFERLQSAEICGVTVTPHVIAESMKYRRPRNPDRGAKVQLFVKGTALPGLFDSKRPEALLESGDWAWHDLNTAISGPADSLSVWTWNGKSSRWGTGNAYDIEAEGLPKASIPIAAPLQWISAITFLGSDTDPQPRKMICHVVNDSDAPLRVSSVRFWLPHNGATWQTLFAGNNGLKARKSTSLAARSGEGVSLLPLLRFLQEMKLN